MERYHDNEILQSKEKKKKSWSNQRNIYTIFRFRKKYIILKTKDELILKKLRLSVPEFSINMHCSRRQCLSVLYFLKGKPDKWQRFSFFKHSKIPRYVAVNLFFQKGYKTICINKKIENYGK